MMTSGVLRWLLSQAFFLCDLTPIAVQVTLEGLFEDVMRRFLLQPGGLRWCRPQSNHLHQLDGISEGDPNHTTRELMQLVRQCCMPPTWHGS